MNNQKYISFSLQAREWESLFFKKNILEMSLLDSKGIDVFDGEISQALATLNYDLIVVNLDVQHLIYAAILEEVGFRLVDSRITFLSLIDSESSVHSFDNLNLDFHVRYASQADEDAIVALTHASLTENLDFISRYKNTEFFDEGDARLYFKTWIINSLSSVNAHSAVVEYEGKVVGFFIFEKRGSKGDYAVYKGILCAVQSEFQGHKLHLVMQSFLFKRFNELRFYLDNTTQVSNYPTLKNHIKSRRQLKEISLTFMKKSEREMPA